jgi:hypothetical protein
MTWLSGCRRCWGVDRSSRSRRADVLGSRQRATLLVVAPKASDSGADAALTGAAQWGDTDEVEALLRSGPRRISTAADDAAPPHGRSCTRCASTTHFSRPTDPDN